MPDVSYFGTIFDTKSTESLPLQLILEEIKLGRWEDMCNTIRVLKDEKQKDKLKQKIPRITYSGRFTTRENTGLIEHSGYIAIDLDDLEDADATKSLLMDDAYVYACFISTGGRGLTVLFAINGSKHRESYLGISNYLFINYGLVTDHGSVAVSKPFGVTFDPNIYICTHKVPIFKDYPKERKVEKIANFAFAKDDFENILKAVIQRGIDLTATYDEWVKIGFAFADKFGEAGENYFHAVSSVSPKYNVEKTSKQYKYCLRHKALKLATISTFYWYAKMAGIQITSERTTKVRKATVNGKYAGLKKEQVAENLKKEGIEGVEDIIEEIYTQSGSADDSGDTYLERLEIFILSNYEIERNQISRYLEMGGKPLAQRELNSIYIAAKKQIKEINYDLTERLLMSEFIHNFNPFTRYFEALPELQVRQEDGTFLSPNIDLLASSIRNDRSEFSLYFMRKWIVSIVSAAHGIHSPLVMVLVGEKQGTGKTEWFRRLFPPDLKRYYAESKLDAGKDDEILMCQKLVIMDDEYSGKGKKEIQRLKELTSKQVFSLREPYGRANVDLLRIAVLCGTSNFRNILYDPTGNRRIIPIPVDEILFDIYNSVDKTLLMAEAYSLWKSGFNWQVLDKEDVDYLKEYEFDYEVLNLEAELIQKYYIPDMGGDFLSSSEIKVEIEQMTNQRLSLDMLGKQMSKMGFEKKSIRENGVVSKKWGVRRLFGGGSGWQPINK